MRLDVIAEIAYPRDEVFRVYRDKLPELVRFIPNVRGITVVSRQDEGTTVKLLNHWKGGGEIPAAVRKVLSADLLEWDDHAEWKEDVFVCHWKTIVPAFKEALDSKGTNRFEPIGTDKTRMTVAGELKVDASKIKGVPRLLAGTVGPIVEQFLVATVKPNLIAVAKAVEQSIRESRAKT